MEIEAEVAGWPTKAAWKRRSWARRSTVTRTRPVRKTVRLADLLERLRSDRRAAAAEVCDGSSAAHERRVVRGGAGFAEGSPYLHIPAQSGSNGMLRRMQRGYSAEEYRELIARIRRNVAGDAVTSDIIVGFCGETDADFRRRGPGPLGKIREQLHLQVQPPPGDERLELYANDVPEEIKRRRNKELLVIQKRSARKTTRRMWAGRSRRWSRVRASQPRKGAWAASPRKWSAAQRATGSWCSTESGDWRAKSSPWSSNGPTR